MEAVQTTQSEARIADLERSAALVCDLGRMGYREAWDLQRRLQAAIIAGKRAGRPVPHALLFVEHPPVYTIGPAGDDGNVLFDEAGAAAMGASLVHTDRGGDVTFHGHGQIVVYPIVDLDRIQYTDGSRGTDIHRYLRALEEAVAATCGSFGVTAGRVEGRTGVWVGPDPRGAERKICAMGIRCSRWVTMHGLAFNVTTDLRWFQRIVPCGIADRGVTSLEVEMRAPPDFDAVRHRLAMDLLEALGLDGDTVAPAELEPRMLLAEHR